MDLNQLFQLISEHKWIAVMAVVIGAVVRLLKSDTPLPFSVPARWRSWLALGLGAVSGVLDSLMAGTPLLQALVEGLGSAMLAIVGHETVVEGLRKGRELFAASPKGSTPTDGVASRGGTLGVLLLVTTALMAATDLRCSPRDTQIARTVVDIASVTCVILRAQVDDGTVQEICATADDLKPWATVLLQSRAHGVTADGSAVSRVARPADASVARPRAL